MGKGQGMRETGSGFVTHQNTGFEDWLMEFGEKV